MNSYTRVLSTGKPLQLLAGLLGADYDACLCCCQLSCLSTALVQCLNPYDRFTFQQIHNFILPMATFTAYSVVVAAAAVLLLSLISFNVIYKDKTRLAASLAASSHTMVTAADVKKSQEKKKGQLRNVGHSLYCCWPVESVGIALGGDCSHS